MKPMRLLRPHRVREQLGERLRVGQVTTLLGGVGHACLDQGQDGLLSGAAVGLRRGSHRWRTASFGVIVAVRFENGLQLDKESLSERWERFAWSEATFLLFSEQREI